jgi:hypothetical protein
MITEDRHKASFKVCSQIEDAGSTTSGFKKGCFAAKVNPCKVCNCPGSELGKVSADIRAHLPGCHIRERLKTGRYTVNISVTPRKITDGNSLGVAIGGEDF